MRVEANDRGIFLAESFGWVVDGGGLWVDVMADVRSGGRAVAVKAGEARMADAWDRAAAADPPGEGWRRTARRVAGQTATVWKRSLADTNASEAAAESAKAVAFIASLAD
jgi:hypothetical protein